MQDPVNAVAEVGEIIMIGNVNAGPCECRTQFC